MIIRSLLLTILSALLANLAFEPFSISDSWNIWLFILIAWIPFLLALRNSSPRLAFYLGLIHGLILYGCSLSWLWSIFGTMAIPLWAMLGLFTAAFAVLSVKFTAHSSLATALLWTGIEYYRCELFLLDFPWITPGTGLPPNWFTPIFGVYGVSFLIILGCTLLIKNKKQGTLLFTIILAATFTFHPTKDDPQSMQVGLVQNESGSDFYYHEQSHELLSKVDLLVWPEYALGFTTGQNPYVSKSLTQRVGLIVTGAKMHSQTEDATQWENSALTYSRDGLLGRHIKNHPVHFFDDGIPGTSAKAITTEFGKIGTPICFDCDYQDVIRKMVKDGAEFFLIPSMDAAHWSARQHEQHHMLFRHRAAENGRELAVASTSGVTQVIDSHGHIRDRLPTLTEDILQSSISGKSHTTLFQHGGWLIGPLSLIASICYIFFQILKQKRNSTTFTKVSSERISS